MYAWKPGLLRTAVCQASLGVIFTPPVDASGEPSAQTPARVKVHVLKCRGQSCGALLAFEETDRGYLLGQVLDLAVVDGEKRYFPCPKCGGHQLVEEYVHAGKKRVRVCGFESV